MKLRIPCMIVLLLSLWGYGYGVSDFLMFSHTFNGTQLKYRLFVPRDIGVNERYPLILTLHGAGERGDDNQSHIVKNHLATVWVRDSNQAKQPSFVLSPQCPNGQQWVDVPWNNGNYEIDNVPISNELAAVVHVLDSIAAAHPIDTNRLYVTGLSMGGYGTWDLICRYPEKFAAAIPVCGAGDSSKAMLIKDIPIWAHHGNQDPVVPVSGSRDMIRALENQGNKILFTHCDWNNCKGSPAEGLKSILADLPKTVYSEYGGVHHDAWNPAYRDTPQLVEWMLSHSREPALSVSITAQVHLNGGKTVQLFPHGKRVLKHSAKSRANLGLYNAQGRLVKTLLAPDSAYLWNGINSAGNNVTDGIYFLNMSGPDKH